MKHKKSPKEHSRFYIVIAIVAAFSGILFGYDTGVISGAILFIKKEFSLSPQMNGLVVSSVLIGAFIGAAFSGRLADLIGRKRLLIIDSIIFIIGSLICTFALTIWTLIFARTFVGIAIGIASYIAPLYISEISPPKHRGALVALNQLAIGVGIFISYIVDYFFALFDQWRGMFAVGVIPALCLLVGMIFLPYSPRWMASKGKKEEALKILERIWGKNANIHEELEGIEKSLQKQRGSWKMLFSKRVRITLVIGMGLAAIQQVTGINTIIYYAPTIFEMAGYSSAANAILATIGIGAIFIIFTFIALPLIDAWGRRPMLFIGVTGMCIGLLGLSYAFLAKDSHTDWMVLPSILIYIASFELGLGPVLWVVVSEIYPLRVRGLGASFATSSNWAANWLVSFSFLSLIEMFGPSLTFFMYFLIGIGAFFFIYFLVPETKGITLETIENNLMAGKSARKLGR